MTLEPLILSQTFLFYLRAGDGPISIAFDAAGQRVFTANEFSDSVSIIELANSNNVIHIPLLPTGGHCPFAIAFDQAGKDCLQPIEIVIQYQ